MPLPEFQEHFSIPKVNYNVNFVFILWISKKFELGPVET